MTRQDTVLPTISLHNAATIKPTLDATRTAQAMAEETSIAGVYVYHSISRGSTSNALACERSLLEAAPLSC